MRFMMMVKHAEISGPPPKELMDAIAILTEEAHKNGTIRGNGGLAPMAQTTRVRLSGGGPEISACLTIIMKRIALSPFFISSCEAA